MMYYMQDKYVEPKKYKYKIEKFAGLDAKSEEDTLPLNYAAYGYNVRIADGVLKEAYGVDDAKIDDRYVPSMGITGQGIKRLFVFKRYDRTTGIRNDRLIVYSDNDKLYNAAIYTDRTYSLIDAQLGSDELTFLNCEYNGKDVLWICDDDGHLILYDGVNVTTAGNTPPFKDACVYNGRVFAASGRGSNVLRFSAENDPTEWDEQNGAGKVIFPDEGGKILRVIVFKESLIIFREYGVYKYVNYPKSSVYTLTKIYCADDKIYPKSVCVCGQKLVFLAGNGFFAYDGSSVSRIWESYFPIITDKKNCSACYFDNKYFLTFYMAMNGEVVGEESQILKNNAFLAIDMDGNEVSVTRGTDIAEFIPVEYRGEVKLLCRFTYGYKFFEIGMITETGRIFSTVLKKTWRSPKTRLGMLGDEKFLRKIYVGSRGEITLRVDLDDGTEYLLPASSRTHCVIVGRKGNAVGLTLTSTADTFRVYGMEMVFDIRRRGIYDD